MLVFALFLVVIAIAPEIALSKNKFTFEFEGAIEQCKPVSIKFQNTEKADQLPVNLTLIPFNSRPFSIPIPNAQTTTSGVSVSFLPLAADTQFMASLDDPTGDNSAKVSDIFRVSLPADGTTDTSCLPTVTVPSQPAYTLLSQNLSQCETFQVRYESPLKAPTVRAFEPKDGSTTLNMTDDNTDIGVATYMMNEGRGTSLALMIFEDGNPEGGITSPLLTVLGGAFSSNECFQKSNNTGKSDSSNSKKDSGGSSNTRDVVIGLSVGGAVIILIAVLAALYYVRQRRRRRQEAVAFDPALLEKSYSSSPPPFSGLSRGGFVTNPIYTTQKFSDSDSDFRKSLGSSSSWLPVQALPSAVQRGPSQRTYPSVAQQSSDLSINPVDIEQMLDYAANDRAGVPTVVVQTSEISPRLQPGRRDLAPDVPVDPQSIASNPFSTAFDSPMRPNSGGSDLSFGSSTNFEMVKPPAPVATGLPSSPRNGLGAPKSRFSNATASVIDDGGIGGFPQPTFARNSLPRDSVESWGNVVGTAR